MAALDWIFVVILFGSLIVGAWRGLVFELLSLAGWVAAFFAAQWWAADVGQALPMGEADGALRLAAGFVVVFVAAVFACGFVAWLMKKLIEAVGLRPADRTLGALFGVLRGCILLLAVALVAQWTQLQETDWWRQSRGAPMLQQALQALKPVIPEGFARHLPS